MKKYVLLIAFCLFTVALSAQEMVKVPSAQRFAGPTEQSEVIDQGGTKYPYAIWMKLLQSGKYSVSQNNEQRSKNQFILMELSKEQIAERNARMPKPQETKNFVTGKAFRPFKTTDINKVKYDLAALKGKVVVLNFWFINCPPCRMEIPDLNELVTSYKDNPDVVFLAVCLDDKYQIKDFTSKSPFLYNQIEEGRFIAQKYGINSYPTHVVIDKAGLVNFHTMGYAQNVTYWLDKSIQEGLKAVAATAEVSK